MEVKYLPIKKGSQTESMILPLVLRPTHHLSHGVWDNRVCDITIFWILKKATLENTDLDYNPIEKCPVCGQIFSLKGIVYHMKRSHDREDWHRLPTKEVYKKFHDVEKWKYRLDVGIRGKYKNVRVAWMTQNFTIQIDAEDDFDAIQFICDKFRKYREKKNLGFDEKLGRYKFKYVFKEGHCSMHKKDCLSCSMCLKPLSGLLEETDCSKVGEDSMREEFEKVLDDSVGKYLDLPKEPSEYSN